jgi:uncharacterized protein
MALILDTGPLVALLDATDPDHTRCTDLIQTSDEPRLAPSCVLVETEYLLRAWRGPFAALLAGIDRGALELLELPKRWPLRAGELAERCRDLSLGLVNASVLAATEMLEEDKLATLDHRLFATVRLVHCDALRLLPGIARASRSGSSRQRIAGTSIARWMACPRSVSRQALGSPLAWPRP